MIFGFGDVSMIPQTNIIYLWRRQDTPNNPRNSRIIFKKITLGNNKKWKYKCWKLWERRGPTNPEDPLNKFLKILNLEYGINIFKSTQHRNFGYFN